MKKEWGKTIKEVCAADKRANKKQVVEELIDRNLKVADDYVLISAISKNVGILYTRSDIVNRYTDFNYSRILYSNGRGMIMKDEQYFRCYILGITNKQSRELAYTSKVSGDMLRRIDTLEREAQSKM